jgi:hypothetical protein
VIHEPNPDAHGNPPPATPFRHKKRSAFEVEKFAVPALAACTGAMLWTSMPNLMTDTGTAANFKALLISASGTLVTYGVNRLSIEKGAPLAAIGFIAAGVLSVAAILVVGTAMFASTFSGLALKDVAQRRLQDHGAALTSFVAERNAASLASARVGPRLSVIAEDLTQYVECEIATGCLSGRGGSAGSVAIALEKLARSAGTVAGQFAAGETSAQRSLAGLNLSLADYQKALNGTESDVWQKQGELLKIHGRIEQQAGALSEAIPTALVKSYADELAKGMTIAGRPEATSAINAVLAAHADGLKEMLADENAVTGSPPAFPARPGVADALGYLAEFASIAGIVFVAEMVLPITLWTYAYLRLSWRIEQAEAGSPTPPPAPPSILPPPASNSDDFGGLIRLPQPPAHVEARPPRGRRRQHHGRRP